MAFDMAPQAKHISYQDTVIKYMIKDGGQVIVITDDQAFSTLLRLTLAKDLGLTAPGLFTALTDPRQLLRELRELLPNDPSPILFL